MKKVQTKLKSVSEVYYGSNGADTTRVRRIEFSSNLHHFPINTILHGDSAEVMKSLPDNCIPLTVTSPPFAKMRLYGGHAYTWETFTRVATQLARITMDGGVICWVVRNQIVNKRENLQAEKEKLFFADDLGLWPHQTILGAPKGVPLPNANRYASNYDYVYVFSKGRPRFVHIIRDRRNRLFGAIKNNRLIRKANGTARLACGGEYTIAKWGFRSNIWSYATGGTNTATDRVSAEHPARMGEPLAEDLIISFSKPGDLVFDPFAGAGTTLKMALLNQRQWLGVEIFDEYVEIIEERMKLAKRQLTERFLERVGNKDLENWQTFGVKEMSFDV